MNYFPDGIKMFFLGVAGHFLCQASRPNTMDVEIASEGSRRMS